MDFEENIERKLVSGKNLSYAELLYVFQQTNLKISPNYNKICSSVNYLLVNLQGVQRDKLVKVLNRDFSFRPKYKYSLMTQEESFIGFESKCVNKNTERLTLNLAKQVKESKRNLKSNPNEITKF